MTTLRKKKKCSDLTFGNSAAKVAPNKFMVVIVHND